ncbi:hypothetical protein P8C59_008019 [Phyllachora maydis]|uniref:Uncharacterized protein n=1 Tax=Phyllachora maydis TaxID=1825666 RepID=A0AAD9ME51_9PEZI|nr:hypothetical protein P8C59_008019 [Phyllachora maydis]
MERPTKRSKIGPSPYDENDEETDELEFAPDEINRRRDPGYRLQKCRHLAAVKLKSRFEDIFAKYSKDFTGVADEIDLATGKVVVDNGHLRSLQDSKFDDDDDGGGGAADDPAATVAPASKKQTPKATPCTPQKAKAKPQARPQPKPGCSPGASATPRSVKRSIISLLPDSDSEDELSLGPDAFTPAGSRRMPLFPPFAASRSPASLGRLSPAGSARKSTTKRGLLLVAAAAASSPLRARDAPFPSRLGGVLASLPVRRVQTHTPTGKGARLGWNAWWHGAEVRSGWIPV